MVCNPELPKGNSSCCSHIERIHSMCHRDTDYIISFSNCLVRKPIPFCSHHNSQPRFSRQYGMIYRDRIISQRHGSSTETKLVQIANRTIQPCPWNQEHRTHRHPYRTAIQRIARIACQQNSIYPKSSCRTEYRPDIGSVHHTVNDYNPPGIPADLFHRGQHRTTHST